MKYSTYIALAAVIPVLTSPVQAQAPAGDVDVPLTGSFSIPATGVPVAPGAAASAGAEPVDASSGLADERLLASQSAPVFSLTEVVALALQNNPQREAAWAAVEAARARIGTAKSAGGLQANLGGNAGVERAFGFPATDTLTSGGGASGSGSTTSSGSWTDSRSLSLSATLPIYTGGRVKASTRVAEHSARAQQAQALATEQELIYNTTISYLNILRSQQLLQVGDANLEVSRERRRVAGVRFDAGAAARLEVFRADTDLAEARQRRIVSSNSLGQSLATLNTLMGRAPDSPLRVEPIVRLTLPAPLFTTVRATPNLADAVTTDTESTQEGTAEGGDGTPGLPEGGDVGVGAPTPTAGATAPAGGVVTSVGSAGVGTITAAPSGQLQTAAGQSRQSIAVSQEQLRAAEASVDVARAARKPNIGIDLLGLLRDPVTFAGRFLLSIGATVAQNLFDSGRTSSQIREAQAVVRQLRSQLRGQEQAVANEIEQSLLSLDSAQKRLASADVGVVAAREALRAARLGYEAGASTALEVSDAQTALLTAETDAVNSRFDVAAAQAQLAAAVGIFPEEAVAAYMAATQPEQR